MSIAPPLFHSYLQLSEAQKTNLTQLGFIQTTPIQALTLTEILQGKDMIAQAQTGSGKTLAFGLGLSERTLKNRQRQVKQPVLGLVLCPTRELANQVAIELRKLVRIYDSIKVLTLCGGTAVRPQAESLTYGADIVVGTPGRVLDLIQRDVLRLDQVNTLVLDEADKMLDMGFYPDISQISLACPLKRQTLLFSATFPDKLLKESEGFLRQPVFLKDELSDRPPITQYFYEVEDSQRGQAVIQLLKHFQPVSTLVFCNTIEQCETLHQHLRANGIYSLTLHGQLEQRDRQDVLVQFMHHSCSVLVATDVAARGLDIQGLDMVLNATISPNAETHLHRIGRTGRQGHAGLALTLVGRDEKFRAERIWQAHRDELNPPQWQNLPAVKKTARLIPPMKTICLRAGKKDKLRAGDLLGALTKDLGLQACQVGKITLFDFVSFVAIDRTVADDTLARWQGRPIKGKHIKMRFAQDD